jgi:hypothetical protein
LEFPHDFAEMDREQLLACQNANDYIYVLMAKSRRSAFHGGRPCPKRGDSPCCNFLKNAPKRQLSCPRQSFLRDMRHIEGDEFEEEWRRRRSIVTRARPLTAHLAGEASTELVAHRRMVSYDTMMPRSANSNSTCHKLRLNT